MLHIQVMSEGDSLVSVWYQSEILIGYLGQTEKGV